MKAIDKLVTDLFAVVLCIDAQGGPNLSLCVCKTEAWPFKYTQKSVQFLWYCLLYSTMMASLAFVTGT